MSALNIKDGILYNNNHIEVRNNNMIYLQILQVWHNRQVDGQLGWGKKFALVKCSFMLLSMTAFVHRYLDIFYSCQRVEVVTQKLFDTFNPLPIPEKPWTDISYNLITGFQFSNIFGSILTVSDLLKKMAHLIACAETIGANKVANLIQNKCETFMVHQIQLFPIKEVSPCCRSHRRSINNLVFNYTRLRLITQVLMDNPRLTGKLWRSMYIILVGNTKTTGKPYYQQLRSRTTKTNVCPLECPDWRQSMDIMPHKEGIDLPSDASQLSKPEWSIFGKVNPSSQDASKQRSSRWSDHLTQF